MPATVQILRFIGAAGGTPTLNNGYVDITNGTTRANAYDPPAVPGALGPTFGTDTNNPIQIPASGSNYSFWVSTRLNVSAAPTGTLNNIRWYTTGSNASGTGINVWVGQANAYVQATGTPGTTGAAMVPGMSGTTLTNTALVQLPALGSGWSPVTLLGGGNVYVTNAFSYTSTQPMLIFSPSPPANTQAAYTSPATGTGFANANLVVYQFEVTSLATAGTAGANVFTWKYDET